MPLLVRKRTRWDRRWTHGPGRRLDRGDRPDRGHRDPAHRRPEPVEGVPALADPMRRSAGDTNPLTAKDAELRTAATGAGSKAERPVELPGVDKADVAQRRREARRGHRAP
jgi:hypothetical protein